MPAETVGWDIGGAHVKAVAVGGDGRIEAVLQEPCPLWQGLKHLSKAVDKIQSGLRPGRAVLHALTMTGEMTDLFAGRDDGVERILAAMSDCLRDSNVLIFAGARGLLRPEKITAACYPAIASANWLASAEWTARTAGADGLFMDVGSTTTDILAIKGGRVCAQGSTDYERLCSRELVYTGIVRTPVMALAQTVSDRGREVGLTAEYFATMADVYRLTGDLNEAHDQTPTADGAGKTRAESARRLARMIGCDFNGRESARWRQLALALKEKQLASLEAGCRQVADLQAVNERLTLVGAGVGRFLASQTARRLGCAYLDFNRLCPPHDSGTGLTPADCAPAAALALLARSHRAAP